MKKVLIVFMALVWTAALMAQRIAVVDSIGSTTIFKTLDEAIQEAPNNSVIYLPGGGFSVSARVYKKLTIIGIGHRSNNDNVDGSTIITGDLYFNKGSDGSAVMGCYITGGVNIGIISGSNQERVTDVLVRYCNVRHVGVGRDCSGIEVNQSYLRNPGDSNHNGRNTIFKNNVLNAIDWIGGGTISNNIILGRCEHISSSIIKNNIFIGNLNYIDNCAISDNLDTSVLGEGIDWNDVFVNYNNGEISPESDFHFKPEYQQYSDCGIYGGDGFSDDQRAPVPYIVEKHIDQQTDASGHLNVRIRVKAGGTE